jgi:hypothetical protein
MRLLVALLLIVLAGCAAPEALPEISEVQENATVIKGSPEQTAILFASLQQQGKYAALYDLFIPQLREKKGRDDFVSFAQAYFQQNNAVLTTEKVVKRGADRADAYFVAFVNNEQQRLPAIELVSTGEGWRVNGFANLFGTGCVDDCVDGNPDDCAAVSCSAETGYACAQLLIPNCSCDADVDCPSVAINVSISNESIAYEKYKCVLHECVLRRAEELQGAAAYAKFQSSPKYVPEISCESLGCPIGTAAFGRKGGWKYYPCDCPKLGWFKDDLKGNVTCFKSFGDALREQYQQEDKC